MIPAPIIVDEQTALYHADPGMATALLGVLQHERTLLAPYLPWVERMQSLPRVRQFLQESALFNAGGQKLILFIYFRKKLVGSVGLLRIDHGHGSAELGFWLARAWQGQHIMSRSIRALIPSAFRQLGLHRLEIRIPCHNRQAMHLPGALGFQREGTLRQAAHLQEVYRDIAVFGLLAADWTAE